jgi:hypothetical protein
MVGCLTGVVLNASNPDAGQKWALGQPDGSGPAVVMTDGKWRDDLNTTIVNAVICARLTTYTYHDATGKYYRFYPTQMTNANAAAQCKADGGMLAITYGSAGLQVLQYYYAQYSYFHIAGTDAAMEGTWVFPDGEEQLLKGTCVRFFLSE